MIELFFCGNCKYFELKLVLNLSKTQAKRFDAFVIPSRKLGTHFGDSPFFHGVVSLIRCSESQGVQEQMPSAQPPYE